MDGERLRLVRYKEDCDALQRITEVISALCSTDSMKSFIREGTEFQAQKLDDIAPPSSRREWCKAEFAVPDFEFINDCTRFDYQRDRVFIRTNQTLTELSRKSFRVASGIFALTTR